MSGVANGNSTSTLPVHVERVQAELIQTKYTFEQMEVLANKCSKSGLFNPVGGVLTADQAFVLMQIADADGIPPIKALLKYHVIKNRPSIKADAALADFQKMGGRHHWLVSNETEVKAEFWHPMLHPEHMEIHLTFKGFFDKGSIRGEGGRVKTNWHDSPAQMLRARAVTQGVRAIAPGVMVGISLEEELESEPEEAIEPPREKLLTALKAQKAAKSIEATATTVQTTPAPATPEKATEKPVEPAKEAVKPDTRTECRKFIDKAVEDVNAEMLGYNKDAKTITALQAANGIIAAGLKDGTIEEDHVNTNGKRDNPKAAATLNALWNESAEWFFDAAGKYFAGKIAEYAAKGPQQGTLLRDDDLADLAEN